MKIRKFILTLGLVMGLGGCSSLAQIFLENASDSRIRYSSHCQSLRMQCRGENYREWETSTGRRGCSCDGPSNQQPTPGDVLGPR
ncbi:MULTISPECIES: hypothetical protein [Microbulbifer]|uniref:hypothetical protein n=1 Tax=Microbulbifer TaxID=48073 RepID=UPI001E423D9A|nr:MULTISPECIES: hypothetical protein [Microbulbifer]UHQ54365.1 hypothetical protein LVE68_12660 [Microbulbifer sp. YPW16]